MPAPTPIRLKNLAAVAAYAARVAAALRPGDAVLLEGELGAGKTAFIRAVLRCLVADPALEVPSPSYTLVQSYDTAIGPVHHLDLWRLDGSAGVAELGWDEFLDGVVLVEWPDRLGALAPPDALTLRLNVEADEARELTRSAWAGRVI